MASFYIPLTGLNADSTALNTIANNLSNMNTTAFKSQSVNFSDLFYQQIGATGNGNPIQTGSGTKVSSIETNFSNGSPTADGVSTHVALQGNGFFVVRNGESNELTRNGNFSLASNGNLITTNGFNVMGYSAVNGAVNASAQLAPINIPVGQVEPPKATGSFGMTATLNSQSAIGATIPGTIQIYDSLGRSYDTTVTYTNLGNNSWSYSISLPDELTPDSSTVAGTTTINYNFGGNGGTLATLNPGTNLTITGPTTSGTATIATPPVVAGESVSQYATDLTNALATAGIVGVTATATGRTLSISGPGISTTGNVIQDPVATNTTGTLTFNSNGNLVGPSSNINGISFAGLSDGASALNMTWNLFSPSGAGTLSQVDQTSAVASTIQDGYSSGQYQSFTINPDGTVSATFSNGQNLAVGQLALGNVTNLQGLQMLGNGDYAPTLASGTISIGTSGTAGLGTMQSGALEASNVNISAEFSNLIIAQRAFEANSKAITTFDTVTQETINMIR